MRVMQKLYLALILAAQFNVVTAGESTLTVTAIRNQVISDLKTVSGQHKPDIRMSYRDVEIVSPELDYFPSDNPLNELLTVRYGEYLDELRIKTTDLRMTGDVAYRTVAWEATLNANGAIITRNGEITNVMERQPDGNWAIRHQSWN